MAVSLARPHLQAARQWVAQLGSDGTSRQWVAELGSRWQSWAVDGTTRQQMALPGSEHH